MGKLKYWQTFMLPEFEDQRFYYPIEIKKALRKLLIHEVLKIGY